MPAAELFLPVIDLVTEGDPIVPPNGLVYSTGPKTWIGSDKISYVVKGPELNIVVPEAIAYQLAPVLGIKVPGFALGRIPDQLGLMFASKKIQMHYRDVEPWIRKKRFWPPDAVVATIIFDIWIANTDRNIGNFIGTTPIEGSPGDIELIALDFEKAAALHGPFPLMSAAGIETAKCWPTGLLSNIVRGSQVQAELVARLQRLDDRSIVAAVSKVKAAIGEELKWSDSIVEVLCRRRDGIRKLLTEAWR